MWLLLTRDCCQSSAQITATETYNVIMRIHNSWASPTYAAHVLQYACRLCWQCAHRLCCQHKLQMPQTPGSTLQIVSMLNVTNFANAMLAHTHTMSIGIRPWRFFCNSRSALTLQRCAQRLAFSVAFCAQRKIFNAISLNRGARKLLSTCLQRVAANDFAQNAIFNAKRSDLR